MEVRHFYLGQRLGCEGRFVGLESGRGACSTPSDVKATWQSLPGERPGVHAVLCHRNSFLIGTLTGLWVRRDWKARWQSLPGERPKWYMQYYAIGTLPHWDASRSGFSCQ